MCLPQQWPRRQILWCSRQCNLARCDFHGVVNEEADEDDDDEDDDADDDDDDDEVNDWDFDDDEDDDYGDDDDEYFVFQNK